MARWASISMEYSPESPAPDHTSSDKSNQGKRGAVPAGRAPRVVGGSGELSPEKKRVVLMALGAVFLGFLGWMSYEIWWHSGADDRWETKLWEGIRKERADNRTEGMPFPELRPGDDARAKNVAAQMERFKNSRQDSQKVRLGYARNIFPPYLERLGGEDKVLTDRENEFVVDRTSQFKFTAGRPSVMVHDRGWLVCVVPHLHPYWSPPHPEDAARGYEGNRGDTRKYVVALSEDGGEKWSFLDYDDTVGRDLGAYFPELVKAMKADPEGVHADYVRRVHYEDMVFKDKELDAIFFREFAEGAKPVLSWNLSGKDGGGTRVLKSRAEVMKEEEPLRARLLATVQEQQGALARGDAEGWMRGLLPAVAAHLKSSGEGVTGVSGLIDLAYGVGGGKRESIKVGPVSRIARKGAYLAAVVATTHVIQRPGVGSADEKPSFTVGVSHDYGMTWTIIEPWALGDAGVQEVFPECFEGMDRLGLDYRLASHLERTAKGGLPMGEVPGALEMVKREFQK